MLKGHLKLCFYCGQDATLKPNNIPHPPVSGSVRQQINVPKPPARQPTASNSWTSRLADHKAIDGHFSSSVLLNGTQKDGGVSRVAEAAKQVCIIFLSSSCHAAMCGDCKHAVLHCC
jgi:hypothetical protein